MKAIFILLWLTAAAYADDVATYAIVVGSNAGGPGQGELRYAEADAGRVGKLLTELGGYAPDQIDIVLHPTPDELRARLGKLADKLAADDKAGRPTRVLFYYSGHARATALDLGNKELPLSELRQRLFELPSKLTVVVLDACQSGAFSRVKGAEPAADFSFNSRQQLDATGVAVLASSSGSELSQESEQLKSSYFTHHLLVGLRGAGDTNHDGLVTVDEAYRYAYHQTLLATTETAVGGQHVSLEVDLKGHGEVPLSFPRAATAHIELPAALEGKTLIEDKRSHTVVAETYKAKGAAVRVAVAPGEYRVLVRRGTTLSRCEVTSGGTVELDHCTSEALDVETTKGGEQPIFEHPTMIEVSLFAGAERHDAYTDTLEAFGYHEGVMPLSAGISLAGLRQWLPHVWLGGLASTESTSEWTRATDGLYPQRFSATTTTVQGAARAFTELGESSFYTYLQFTIGLGIGRTQHRDQSDMETRDTYFGPALSASYGVGWQGHRLGLGLAYTMEYAHVIDNLVGDTHASGGHRFGLAGSWSF